MHSKFLHPLISREIEILSFILRLIESNIKLLIVVGRYLDAEKLKDNICYHPLNHRVSEKLWFFFQVEIFIKKYTLWRIEKGFYSVTGRKKENSFSDKKMFS